MRNQNPIFNIVRSLLDERVANVKDVVSFTKLSYITTLKYLHFLDELSVIEITKEGKHLKFKKLQKLYSQGDFLVEIFNLLGKNAKRKRKATEKTK